MTSHPCFSFSMKSFKITTKLPEDTILLGSKFAELMERGDLVLLEGELGAGKTTFVKGIAEKLGAGGQAKSPTFTLLNVYSSHPRIFHFDLYRTIGSDLIDIGLDDVIDEGVVIIEWGDKAKNILPEDRIEIDFKYRSQSERNIEFRPVGENWKKRLNLLSKEIKI